MATHRSDTPRRQAAGARFRTMLGATAEPPRGRATTHSRESFVATLEECVAWRRENGSLPRSEGGEADETRLGLWLTAMTRKSVTPSGCRTDAPARRPRRLAPCREHTIDRAIPGWDIGLAHVG